MGKDRLLKTCAVCGAEFHAVRTSQVCCSLECSRALFEGKSGFLHTCVVCGKEFRSTAPNAKLCSVECRQTHKCDLQKKRRNVNRRAGKPRPHKELICPVCGKQCQSERGHKYCSEECRQQAMKEYHARHSKQVSCDLTPPLTRKCHDCGAPTSNYRCPRCLSDWKIKHAVPAEAGDIDERYSICR